MIMGNSSVLHSHSGIERVVHDREIMKKRCVLVDKEFLHIFSDVSSQCEPFAYGGKQYWKVPTMLFYMRGGVFKGFKA